MADLTVSGIVFTIEIFFNFSFDSYNQIIFNTVFASIIYCMTILIMIGVPLLLKNKRTAMEDLGFSRLPVWSDILLTPISVVSYFIVSVCLIMFIKQLFPDFDVNHAQDTGFTNLGQSYEYLLAFITLVVIAPIAEETIFRGYLYGKLKKTVPIWAAVILTSLVFGMVHGEWNLAVDTFALSIVLCLLCELTGSIWASILLHMSKNFIAYFALFIYPLL